ncbi:hypothetical protein A6V39_00155 [Candidatus Mycoplasma haematobovis]|uniref:Uncharacterized protein n=1 Tax=Candidatus Mycoplasma haematobovis TaxID=432608 RepID=A0A1A9QEM1_9MOLU|nr:hypothetical protein [Candidatus Mycoplasma haematobovis]OAL10461.1 hypothetical protein A6V39_00155 [Candidatus Mycoplasma haematobovis]
MVGIRSSLFSILSVSVLGGVATGGYFLFKPGTSENVNTSKNTTENSSPNRVQNNLNESQTQDQNLGTRGASNSERNNVSDPAQTQPSSSNPPAAPSQGAGGAGDSSVQLPSR